MDLLLSMEDFSNTSNLFFPNLSVNILDLVKKRELMILGPKRDSLATVVAMTLVYTLLLITGVIGNVCTCIVISRNRYMHTATNYYLFSLAVSDILLLVMGLPQEMYELWVKYPYIFGETFCIFRGFTAETSTNASILTITAFTVERYVAICHPLRAHTMSRLSRAVKTTLTVWVVAAFCAVPVALQFGVIYRETSTGLVLWETAMCAVKRPMSHAFAISSLLFFILPLWAITVLYVKIGIRLRISAAMGNPADRSEEGNRRESGQGGVNSSRRSIIRMLVAVVVSFFLCWSPFHAQRLMAIYINEPTYVTKMTYTVLTYISGVTYYLSATINPILYQLMSLKFQQAFKDTFGELSKCLKGVPDNDVTVTLFGNVTENSRVNGSRRKTAGGQYVGQSHPQLQNTTAIQYRSSLSCIDMAPASCVVTQDNGNAVHTQTTVT